ncbi:hypothetical protein [Atlantibacter sp.]|uniref:hypothetical protein n=1 Tax=Atlantibacter sp. TaxID=1903473 RepID=UPI0028A60757|nr:hypothetical protein [Atlantibacter sp.]
MSKLITSVINIVICSYIVSVCLICLIEFDAWQDKTIAVIIAISSAYIIIFVLNRFLPEKIRISSGVFDLLSGPLLIIGAITCIVFLEPWPVKIIGMFLWVIVMFWIPSFIDKE